MKREICLQIQGRRCADGQAEPELTEVNADGVYYCKDGCHYIRFRENAADGFENTTTTVKCREQEVTLMRSGGSGMHFVFRAESPHTSYYETPFGRFPASVLPKEVAAAISDEGGQVVLEYRLDFAGEVSDNIWKLNFKWKD